MGGLRVPASGAAVGAGSFAEGQTYGALPFPSTTLEDADAAEVHVVLRTHGRYIPGIADEQITSFEGGCTMQDCADLQFAIFPPGGGAVQRAAVYRFADGQPVPLAWAALYRDEGGIRAAIHTDMRADLPICAP